MTQFLADVLRMSEGRCAQLEDQIVKIKKIQSESEERIVTSLKKLVLIVVIV